MQLPYSPHDLLPIDNPLTNEPEGDLYFYENVVKHLIPDILEIESNGIPIDLNKVKELETTVDNVLISVKKRLDNNHIIQEFLKEEHSSLKKGKQEILENKRKSVEDFIKPFDPKNKIHRTFVVNTYLVSQVHNDKVMDEWSIKDLKILNQIIGSKFIQNIIDKNIESWMIDIVNLGMTRLAVYKCEAYNKSKINSKIEELDNKITVEFNPASSTQKRKLFEFLGIESENETKAGNEKWDRKEIENLQKILINLIGTEELKKEI